MKSDYIASVHKDYIAFVALATDEELGQFVRAQVCLATGQEPPELAGIAKALLETHMALIERLDKASRKKSEAGKMGGNPKLKEKEIELKRCLSDDKAVVKQRLNNDKPVIKPVSVTEPEPVTVSEPDTEPVTVSKTREKPARQRAKPPAAACDALQELSPEVQTVFGEYVKARVKLRRPMTPHAIALAVKKLRDVAGDDPVWQIAHINRAIECGWMSFFPLKDPLPSGPGSKQAPSFADLYKEQYGEEVIPFGSQGRGRDDGLA